MLSFRDTMDLTEEQVQILEDVFRQNLPPNQNTLTLKEFKKFMPSKNVRKQKYFCLKFGYVLKLLSLNIFNLSYIRHSSLNEPLRYSIVMGVVIFHWRNLLTPCINLQAEDKLKRYCFFSRFMT